MKCNVCITDYAVTKYIQGHIPQKKKKITEADVWIHVTCKQVDVSILRSINWNIAE